MVLMNETNFSNMKRIPSSSTLNLDYLDEESVPNIAMSNSEFAENFASAINDMRVDNETGEEIVSKRSNTPSKIPTLKRRNSCSSLNHNLVLPHQNIPFIHKVGHKTTQVKPFSFEAREKERVAKKEEHKPEENQSKQFFKARSMEVLNALPFTPKKSTKPLTQVAPFELHTEKRAPQREMSIREKERENERLKKWIAKQNEDAEKKEIMKMRAATSFKAQPIRAFKPLVLMKTEKKPIDVKTPQVLKRTLSRIHLNDKPS